MKKAICLLVAALLIGVLIGVFILPLLESDKTYSKQEIEAIQIEYYTYGFRDGQECGYITRTGIVRLNDTLPISPETIEAGKWSTIDSIISDTTVAIDENRYKYYRMVFTPSNNEMVINAIWYDSMQLSPESMQEILDAEIGTTYPRYSLPKNEGSRKHPLKK